MAEGTVPVFGTNLVAATEQENVAELQFGPEFDQIHVLSNAQVDILLQMSARAASHADEEINEVYRKTQKYVSRFNSMTNAEKSPQEVVNELDNLQDALTTFRKETEEGEDLELHGSEVAALMNLVATDTLVEEAVALIPSLSRFPEAAIDEILDLIRSTMMRIVS
jgi:DNA-directed RNA polymerase II subunit RPB4